MRLPVLLSAACAAAIAAAPAAARPFSAPASFTVPITAPYAFAQLQAAVAGPEALIAGGPALVAHRGGALAPVALPPLPRRASDAVLAGGGATAIAAWRRDSPRSYAGVEASVRSPDGTWSAPAVLADESAQGARGPRLAVDEDGAAVVAYTRGTRSSHLNLYGGVAVAHRPAGGAFGASETVAPRGVDVRVAIAGGHGAVVWRRSGRVWAALVDRTGVGRSRALGRGRDAAVGVRPDGGVVVAWTRESVLRRGRIARVTGIVEAAHRPPGGRFGAPQRVVTARRAYLSVPRVVAAGRRTVVTWAVSDTPGGRARTRLWHRAFPGPGRAELLVDGVGRGWDTDVAGLADGRIAAAWTTRGVPGRPLRPWVGIGRVGAPLEGVRVDGAGPSPGTQVGPLQPVPDASELRLLRGPGTAVTAAWRSSGPSGETVLSAARGG